ncbi:MAG: GatB/YqeY domain-containing protein [Anaerolineae bacterium]|nr:GatB/YqeY domain-containing protein [Anaerolineae bacterium]
MHPKEKLQDDLKTAMKAGDTERRHVLRQLMAAIKQVEKDEQRDLSPEDAIGVLMSEAKKWREEIEELEKAGRTDTIEEKQRELAIIEGYLPQQLDRAALEALVKEAIAEVGATTPRDMGNVMKALMPRVKGQADGKLVNQIVRELLS